MANPSTKAQMQVFEEQFHGGFVETIAENSNLFNDASQNCIRLIPNLTRGDFHDISFFTRIGGLVVRRDVTDSTTSATALQMTQDKERLVKRDMSIGPVEVLLDAFKKVEAGGMDEFGRRVGIQAAKAVQVDMARSGLIACEAALAAQTAVYHNATDGTLASTDLATALSKLGDQAEGILMWLMHSKVYYDLLTNQITNAIYRANDVRVMEGVPATLGRPVLVTDAPSLLNAASPDQYVTLGLTEDAITIEESEERTIVAEFVTGKVNLVMRYQGEIAYNVGVKGFKWGTTVNPTDAQLATSGNWTQVAASHKNLAGVRILSQ